MGANLSTVSVAFAVVTTLVGIAVVFAEQLDQKLESILYKLGRTQIRPKVYGWTIEQLEKIKEIWEKEDTEGMKIGEAEQV